MRAKEFVNKFGWSDSRFYLSTASDGAIWISFDMPEHGIDNIILNVAELKRLVESHELVEKLGGLDGAKTYVPDGYKSERLKQAIADVESCQ